MLPKGKSNQGSLGQIQNVNPEFPSSVKHDGKVTKTSSLGS